MKILKGTTIEKMWIDDLDHFLKVLDEVEQEEEENR